MMSFKQGHLWGGRLLFIPAFMALFPAACWAVNFYDGARAPAGKYVLSYTSLYHADTTTDKNGRTAQTGYDYTRIEELARFCYYTPDAVFTALVPAGRVRSGYYGTSSSGIGDILAGVGYFVPLKEADILPMLFVKFPTGEYDSAQNVNYGTNQYDIRSAVFFYTQAGRFSIDAAIKYHVRLKNRGTNSMPGDELHLQLLPGWKLGKRCKLGPSLNWMKSRPQEKNGAEVPDSRRESFSAGADFYVRLKPVSITLTFLRDIRAKNAAKGDFFQLKTCYAF